MAVHVSFNCKISKIARTYCFRNSESHALFVHIDDIRSGNRTIIIDMIYYICNEYFCLVCPHLDSIRLAQDGKIVRPRGKTTFICVFRVPLGQLAYYQWTVKDNETTLYKYPVWADLNARHVAFIMSVSYYTHWHVNLHIYTKMNMRYR